MAYGLLNSGNTTKKQAKAGFQQSAQAENSRNIANDNIAMAESTAKKTNAATGASTGATIGASMASGAGLGGASILASGLASGGIGLAAGLLLTELL